MRLGLVGWRLLMVVTAFGLTAGCSAPGSAAGGSARSEVDMAAARAGAVGGSGGVVRQYFVQAEQVWWDYAPRGRNVAHDRPFTAREQVYTARGPQRVGSVYLKCVYRGYTDASFRHRLTRPAAEAYMGLLGPTLHAVVGDTLRVVFRNRCTFPTSMHPHGVQYDKASEGASYNGTPPGSAGIVPPGGQTTYLWRVPQRSGPGPMDGSSVGWMYHSHADEIGDVYAGLTGFLVVTARGQARPDGTPKDVDREVFSLFEVMNENASPLLAQTVARYAPAAKPLMISGDEAFGESNLMHAINGYVYANGPTVQIVQGQRTRWYLMGMGTEVDLHTPHWHGNTVTINGMRSDVATLLPASMVTADMTPDTVGTWLFHCHVGDHITAGMQTLYTVDPSGTPNPIH